MSVLVCVVCIAVPIVRWRSVRCAAVRRPLSSSLLALWQASRQLPEMQDSALGKEIFVLSPCPPLPPPFAPPPPHSLCYAQPLLSVPRMPCEKRQKSLPTASTQASNSFFSPSDTSGMTSSHTNPPKLHIRPESNSLCKYVAAPAFMLVLP